MNTKNWEKRGKILFIAVITIAMLGVGSTTGSQTNSTHYAMKLVALGSGSGNSFSTHFDTNIITGMITGSSNSTHYAINLGFFYGSEEGPTYPKITFVSPTPSSGNTTTKNYVYLNTTVTDAVNTSSFFDWNRSLVGYWNFEYYNTSGIFDNSSYKNFGKFYGGLSTNNITTGKYGTGLKFDGVNDYLNATATPLNSTFTISYWYRSLSNSSTSMALSQARYQKIGQAAGKFFIRVTIGIADNSTPLPPPNNWHMATFTRDSANKIDLYIDNGPANRLFSDVAQVATFTLKQIGGNIQQGEYFNGTLDEIRVFNKALSAAEINASYNSGKYRLYHNFTGLSNGLYTYNAWAINSYGNINKTATRNINVSFPVTLNISFYAPANGTVVPRWGTFKSTATIKCLGVVGSQCGQVYGSIRYNKSNPMANTLVNTSKKNPLPFMIKNYTGGDRTALLQWNNTFVWGYQGFAVTSDSNDNVIITGRKTGSGMLTVKYDSAGNLVWNRTVASGYRGRGITTDSSDNVIVAGHTTTNSWLTVKYNSTGGFLWNSTLANSYWAYGVATDRADNVIVTGQKFNGIDYDFLTAKYNKTGGLLWNRTFLSGGEAIDVATDRSNNIVITGYTSANDFLTVKYNSTGGYKWNRTYSPGNRSYGISIDSKDNVLVTGYNTNYDYLTVKYNNTGGLIWNRSFVPGQVAYDVATDSLDNVIVTGFNASTKYLTVKYDPSGNQIWNRTFAYGNYGRGIATDSQDNVLVTGYNLNYDYITVKYLQGKNPQRCPTMTAGQSCNLSWILNTTAPTGAKLFIDIYGNSSLQSNGVASLDSSDRAICVGTSCGPATTIPKIKFVPPTPTSGNTTTKNYIYLNTTVTDAVNTSSFFDWNRSLVGYWNFEYYNSTGLLGNSTYKNFAKFAGGLSMSDITTGKYGKGLKFDGINDYMNVSPVMPLNNTFTVSYWYYTIDNDSAGMVISQGEFQKFGQLSGKFFVRVTNGGSDNTIVLPGKNSWHMATWTRDSSNKIDLYVDNGPAHRLFSDVAQIATFTMRAIGVNTAQYQFFNGTLDEIRIFNRVLSPIEINATYNSGRYRLYNNFTGLGLGTYTYSGWTINSYGNINKTWTRNITLLYADTAPSVWLRSPTTNYVTSGTTINLQCNATDDQALKNISLYNNMSGSWKINTTIYLGGIRAEDNELVLLMHFNNDSNFGENQKQVYDYSGSGHNGNCTNCPQLGAGKIGKAYLYNGVTSGNKFDVHISGDLGSHGSWTTAAWVNLKNKGTNYHYLVTRWGGSLDGLRLYARPQGNNFSVHYTISNNCVGGGGIVTTPPVAPFGSWHYLVGVYNHTTQNAMLYIDGVLRNTTAMGFSTTCGIRSDIQIGGWDGWSGSFTNGTIDELAIWNRTLSASEVLSIYNYTKKRYTANFTLSTPNVGTYKWNCLAYDNKSQSSWGATNWTFRRINSPPATTLMSPASGSATVNSYITLKCNVSTDSEFGVKNISFYANLTGSWKPNKTVDARETQPGDKNLLMLMHFSNDSSVKENSTKFYDWTGHQNNGICYGANCPLYSSGKFGKGITFDAANDYVNMTRRVNLTSNFTVTYWYNGKSTSIGIILGEAHGQAAGTAKIGQGGGKFLLRIADDTENNISLPAINSWHYVAVTRDRLGKLNLSYDGGTPRRLFNNTAEPWTFGIAAIGANGQDYSQTFNGSIDEITAWNRTLSITEINRIYNYTKNKYTTNITLNVNAGSYKWNCLATDTLGQSAWGVTNWTFIRTTLTDNMPAITLVIPANGLVTTGTNVTLKCNATDDKSLKNISFWTNVSGTWRRNKTIDVREAQPGDNSLQLLLHFNNDSSVKENSTRFNDWSGRGSNAICYGTSCPAYGTGKFGKAMNQDGINDYVNLTKRITLASTFTMSYWYNGRNNPALGMIIGEANGVTSGSQKIGQNAGKFFVRVIASQTDNTIALPAQNNWHFVVITRDVSNKVDLYYDGSTANRLFADAAQSGNFIVAAIGANGKDYSQTFNGSLDEVAIWNRTLSAAEIRNLYNSTKPRYAANLTLTGLSLGSYKWNCLAFDNISQGSWATSNWTFKKIYETPGIKFANPTPSNGNTTTKNYVYLNSSIRSTVNTSAFFDWNRSLAGYWSFDYYNSTGAFDNSTYKNFAKFGAGTSTPNVTAGKYGRGVLFDGLNDYINVVDAKSLTPTKALTLSMWVRPKSITDGVGKAFISKWIGAGANQRSWSMATNWNSGYADEFYLAVSSDGANSWFVGSTNANLVINQWAFVVATYNGTNVSLYKDTVKLGTYVISGSNPGSLYDNTANVTIGSFAAFSSVSNITIDEVRIYSRVLSQAEINASYNSGKYRLYHNFTGLSNGLYTYNAWAINSYGNINKTKTRNITIISNYAPTISAGPAITPSTPNRLKNLTCTFTISDADASDTLFANYTWYNGTSAKFNGRISVTKDVSTFIRLSSSNLTNNNRWNCSITPYDNIAYGVPRSTNVTIRNYKPNVTLIWPNKGNATTDYNRTPQLRWHGSDVNGDKLNYTLTIRCMAADCGGHLDKKSINITSENWTVSPELEVDVPYNWTVQAYDGINYSSWSSVWNFTVASKIGLTLTNAQTAFGVLNRLQDVNTTKPGDSINPLVVRNDGNIITKVSVFANKSLFLSSKLNTSSFMFKAGNASITKAFNWTGSQTSWRNVSDKKVMVLKQLNYSSKNNNATVELRVQVPISEPPGNRITTMIIAGDFQ